jgi:hypothetical protein
MTWRDRLCNILRVKNRSFRDRLPRPCNRVEIVVTRPDGTVRSRSVTRNLRTTAGRDFQAAQMSGTPGAAANYIALSADAIPPSTGDTVLAGELGGSLARKPATYSHTAGTPLYLLQTSFVADQPVTIRKAGMFDAPSGGTLVFETQPSPETVAAGDTISVSWSVDLGA